jgi:hypothetical protein
MILPAWEAALRLHQRRRARVDWEKYDQLIAVCLERLRQQVDDVTALRAHYGRGTYWAVQLARRMFPGEPPGKLDPHYFADVAYGLRYRELTGAPATAPQPGDGDDDQEDDDDA